MRPPTEIVSEMYAAFARGDIEAVLELLAPDVRWVTPTTLPWSRGEYAGRDGVGEYFGRFATALEDAAVQPHELIDCGDRVVALGEERARVRRTGRRFASPFVHVISVKDGRVALLRWARRHGADRRRLSRRRAGLAGVARRATSRRPGRRPDIESGALTPSTSSERASVRCRGAQSARRKDSDSGADDGAVAVERGEGLGELEGVGGDPVRRAPVGGLRDLVGEREQLLDELALGGIERAGAGPPERRAVGG